MSLLSRPLQSARRQSPPCTTIVRDIGDAVRTQCSGGQPKYEPIRAACNRLAQLSTCTYLLQRRCDGGERPSLTLCAAPRHSLREALYCVCVSLVKYYRLQGTLQDTTSSFRAMRARKRLKQLHSNQIPIFPHTESHICTEC